MAWTVKELSELSGVSIRTLHYYDEIGKCMEKTNERLDKGGLVRRLANV